MTNSLSRKVGAAPAEKFAKITHAVPMLSLGNIFSDDELVEFVARVKRFLGRPAEAPLAFTAEPKIDGLSCSICATKTAFWSAPRRAATVLSARTSPPMSAPSPTFRNARGRGRRKFSTCAARSI